MISLAAVIAHLSDRYGPPPRPATTDPFEMILWECAAYLVDDERRTATFEALREDVGLTPQRILEPPFVAFERVARLGGMVAQSRVEKLRHAAALVMDEFGGDLRTALDLPLPKARKALRRFPGVGAPMADRILLYSRKAAVLPLDSNALRVLCRIGFAEEDASYDRTYRAVQKAIADQISAERGEDYDDLIAASILLRQHGQQLCKRTRPRCGECPIRPDCGFVQAG